MPRHVFVRLHRYVGLVMAGFLIITGLTGTALVWYTELDRWINPQLLVVDPPAPITQPLSPFVLREKVEQSFPSASVNWMTLQPQSATSAQQFSLDPRAADIRTSLEYDEVFVNPYNGEILGGRRWGDLSQGMVNLMPFIYRLHHALASGSLGVWLLGLIALLWTLDCFIGLYLTWPRRSRNPRAASSRLKRWRRAWTLRWRGSTFACNFDLHTAVSLWFWLLLLVFAWSSVSMTLYDELYKPVMGRFMQFQPRSAEAAPRVTPSLPQPSLGWERGFEVAQSYLHTLAQERGFQIEKAERFAYYPDTGMFKLMARTSRDINERFGQSWVYINAHSGSRAGFYLPTGEALGDSFTTWLTTLHIAGLWGLPYRILVSVTGLIVPLLCVTGVLIWWRKSRLHRSPKQRSKRQ